MAIKVPAQSGNWSSASTWASAINTSTNISTSTITLSSSNVYTETFTAPSLISNCTGVVIPISSLSSSGVGTFTIALQLFDGISTWSDVATGTIDLQDIESIYTNSSGTIAAWYRANFSTPYMWTTLTANRYRVRIIQATGSRTIISYQSSTSASNFFALVVDSTTGVPASTDTVFICGNNTTEFTVTMDGTITIGSGVLTSVFSGHATLSDAIQVCSRGVLKADTSASVTVNVKGALRVSYGGKYYLGTSASKIPAANTVSIIFNNEPSANYGYKLNFGGIMGHYSSMESQYFETTISSGVGTAASPVIFANSVDWAVGDYLAFMPGTNSATNYNEVEYRYIKTKNSATSYVLSNTAGGAEAALTYSHGTSPVLKLNRNITVTNGSSSSSRGNIHNFSINGALGDCDINCTSFTNGAGITLTAGNNQFFTGRYLSVYTSLNTTTSPISFGALGLGSYLKDSFIQGASAALNTFSTSQSNSLILDNIVAYDTNASAFTINAPSGVFNRLRAYGANKSNTSTSAAFLVANANADLLVTNSEAHASRNSIRGNTSYAGRWVNTDFGSKADNKNTHIININTTDTEFIFDNLTLNSGVLDVNLATSGNNFGAKVGIQAYNGADSDCRFITSQGYGVTTGTGLSDTTVKTTGSKALRLEPRTSTFTPIMTHKFNILSRAGKATSIVGYARKNSLMQNQNVTINLYLPGSTSPDDTVTLTNTADNWQLWSLAASYSGTIDRYSIVEVVIQAPSSSGAYLYLDDIFNGTNPITALDVWDNGYPSQVMFETLGDAAAVWAVAAENFVAGTTGDKLLVIDIGVKNIPSFIYGK